MEITGNGAGEAGIDFQAEAAGDMYISTVRDFVRAMGGELEITPRFPEGKVRINQFDLKKTA